jgi:hypothetical protein
MVKYKDSHRKSSIRSHMEKETYNDHGNISHTKNLLRHKSPNEFGDPHKTSTSQDQLKIVESEAFHMKSLTLFYMKKNTN